MTLKINGHSYMSPDRFEPPRDGRIELLATGFGGLLGQRAYGLVWADSAWTVRWFMAEPNGQIWPALTTPDRQMLVWKTRSPPVDTYYNHLVTADVVGGSVTRPDTVAKVSAGALVYAGTAWGDRRWVAVRDQDFSTLGFPEVLKIYRRDPSGPWRQMGPTGLAGYWGMRIAALDSMTVLLVCADYHAGVRWGLLRDTVFTEEIPALSPDRLALTPALNPRPGGGFWCAWDGAPDLPPDYTDIIVLQGIRNRLKVDAETLIVSRPFDSQFIFGGVELSAEGSEFPALAWLGYSPTGPDAADYVWTSFPSDTSFGVGERLEGSRDAAQSTILRDENGDVWVAWWRYFEDGLFWLHSYTTAHSSPPRISERDGRPLVGWKLSEPAPETWWAVLRAVSDGEFVCVARIQAGADTSMTWADTTAPAGVALRYAIRRECRDARYQTTTSDTRWEPRSQSLGLKLRGPNPATHRLEFDVVGANAGPIFVKLYDLQGRLVVLVETAAVGGGRDGVSVPLPTELRPGLYLLRVTAADGREGPTTKVAVIQ